MKKFIYLVLGLFIQVTIVSAQNTQAPKGYTKIDAQLKYLLNNPKQLEKDYSNQFKNKNVLNPKIPIIFKSSSKIVRERITQYGGEVNSQFGDIYTAVIPLNYLVEFAANNEIVKIESSEKVKVSNQKAKELTGADRVHAGQLPGGNSYTGKDVVIGIFDTGIDFAHTDFRKKTDSTRTRILSIWDQTKNGGIAPQNYNYGSEYSNTQINAALSNPNSLNTSDTKGHGTHVAGSAAGLRGMAPDADIVFVTGLLHWDSDSTLYQDSKSLLDGLNYIKDKATEVGKPCVVNLSVAYYLGSPHDGSSLVEQAIDYLVSNNSGFFVVVGAGNENGNDQHFGGFELTKDSVWTYIKNAMLYSIFESEFSDSTYISFGVDSATVIGPNWDSLSTQKPVYQSEWLSISNIKESLNGITLPAIYSNGDTAMMIKVTASDFDVKRTEVRIYTAHGRQIYNDSLGDFGMARLAIKGKGMLHAWWEFYQVDFLDNPFWYRNVRTDNRLKYSDNNYTMNILACCHNTIAVGAFVNQTSFINKSGQQTFGGNFNQDSSGTFAYFSNLGPTTDGRIKPEISAPGINVASSFSRHAAFPLFFHIDSKTVALSGTSMAAPIVAGAIALYLEKFPTATFENIKSAITENAIVDSLVTKFGAVPNNHFGYGRLDIYQAINNSSTSINESKSLLPKIAAYPNPAKEIIKLNTKDIEGTVEVNVYDLNGIIVAQLSVNDSDITLDVEKWSKGFYFFTVKSNNYDGFGEFIIE